MKELSPNAYERAIPVIQASGMQGHLALAYEVLEGRQAGQVFVDDIANPRTVLLCNPVGFYFAFGEPAEALVQPLIEALWEKREDVNYTTLFGSTPAWDAPLGRIFLPLGATQENRLAFELSDPPPAKLVAPQGFVLQPITVHVAQSIFDGTGTDNFGIDPWFIRIEGGPEGYASHGLGMALLTEAGQVASICGYCGLGCGEAELEVGTVPAYRGHGLAAAVTQAFMEQARAQSWKPAYSCTSDNLPSIRVAHRLGFHEFEEIHGFRLDRIPRR